jgi:hypothetical protein
MRMHGQTARRGNVMIVVAVMCLLAFIGLSSFDFLTRTDVSTTGNLIRELRATYLAESISAQIESRVNRHPWEERFWWLATRPQPRVPFYLGKSGGHVKIAGDVPENEYDYNGFVQDRDENLREYRIVMEVRYQQHQYTFTWDKKFEESLIGGLNRDTSRLDKQLEEFPPGEQKEEETNTILDRIKAAAESTPTDRVNTEFADLLKRLRTDQAVIQGAAGLPEEPPGEPSMPAPPTIQPPNQNSSGN